MPPKKKADGYKRSEPISKGQAMVDSLKQKWVVGASIGSGGFGDIYMAASGEIPPQKDSDYSYVVKIEPHENGPLFVERHFYSRAGRKDHVSSYMSSQKLKSLGMPVMHGSGILEIKGVKHRFLVIDRFSKDLWSLFLKNNRSFPLITVLRIALQVIDVLEYIHHHNYVHADIKGANLLLGFKKGTENKVYLVDFGLVSKFSTGEYKRDPKRAHNGTLEYTSRDAHFGVPTRRGDLEILAYNMVQWTASKLPWEECRDVIAVEKQKHDEMKNVPGFLKKCFGKRPVPDVLSSYVQLVAKMEPNESPDYSKVKKILTDGIKALGSRVDGPLEFSQLEEQLEEQENVPMKLNKARKPPNKRTKADQNDKPEASTSLNAEASSSDSDEISPQEKKRSKKTTVKKSTNTEAKPSWRDCQTVKVSKVVKAGEYISTNPKRKKNQ